jgi:hypothetical protein
MAKLTVRKIPRVNTLVLTQTEGQEFFVSTKDNIVISISSLAFIISFLVKNGYVNFKVLEGILEEYNSTNPASLEVSEDDFSIS